MARPPTSSFYGPPAEKISPCPNHYPKSRFDHPVANLGEPLGHDASRITFDDRQNTQTPPTQQADPSDQGECNNSVHPFAVSLGPASPVLSAGSRRPRTNLYRATKKYATDPNVIKNPARRSIMTKETIRTSDMRVSSRPQHELRILTKYRLPGCPASGRESTLGSNHPTGLQLQPPNSLAQGTTGQARTAGPLRPEHRTTDTPPNPDRPRHAS